MGFYPVDLDEINHLFEAYGNIERDKRERLYTDTATPEAMPYAELEADEAEAGHYLKLTCDNWRAIKKTPEGHYYTPLTPKTAEWRAVTWTETRSNAAPPRQEGDRWTSKLSANAKKQIEYSAKYSHRIGRGYRTFLTLTFNQEWRHALAMWDWASREHEGRQTIGKLVTEFLNVLQQRHRNGKTFEAHWRRAGKQYTDPETGEKIQPKKWREAFTLQGSGRPFNFTWVIENPDKVQHSDYGPIKTSNPHVHILMDWHVKYDQFTAWAEWIESAWGKGYAKLERIKKPASAAAYMAKAANYISKGASGHQGAVRGNRYSVSRDARAPRSRIIGLYAASFIRQIIEAGYMATRENVQKVREKGLYFHRHGFGAKTRKAWGRLWSTLKKDGYKLDAPPDPLVNARAKNNFAKVLRNWWTNGKNAALDYYEKHGPHTQQLTLEELNQHWGAVH